MFAKVIVSIKTMPIDETFDYIIPDALAAYIDVGSRVIVPFGFQEAVGYVLEVVKTSAFSGNLKPIKEVLGLEKELELDQIALAKHLSDTINVPLAVTLDLMMPSFLKEKRKKYIYVEDANKLDATLAVILGGKKKILLDEAMLVHYELIKKEEKKHNLSIGYDFTTYGHKKKVKTYATSDSALVLNEPRKLIWDYVSRHPHQTIEEICIAIGASDYLVKKMAQDGQLKTVEKIQLPQLKDNPSLKSDYVMNFDQNELVEKFYENKGKPFLLFSDDEIFKIEFFMKLVMHYVQENKSTIIVAPSVMLVEEVSWYLRAHFSGLKMHTYHSKNTMSDNYDCYMAVKNDHMRVLVTTPMGVFLPFKNVGLVIAMDEDNNQYIHENYPNYHAIEVLIERSRVWQAKLLLSSSAPSIATYYKTQMYHMFLLEYIAEKKNKIEIVDMREELLEENNHIVSTSLKKHMKLAMQNNEITMLIVNNKSFSTQIKCRGCGEVLKCPRCKIPLTYIHSKKLAKCNYCDYKQENIHKCACGSEQVMLSGFGLEQVAKVIGMQFPKANVIQVDSDSIKSLDDYNFVLTSIEEKTVDIIIGTNILTKTLKYDNISVVGLLYVDSYLYHHDHRASEYTYQLIAKMANKPVCIIQTYHKDHYAIVNASLANYDAFYAKEIAIRKMLDYEPFYEMNRVIITGAYNKMFHFANYFRKAIRHLIGDRVLGPTYDYKQRGVKLVIKHNQYQDIKKVLQDAIKHFNEPELDVRFERYPKEM